jgi:NAD(P)-dependent dehydrogenase (short-subunit alcohol dehydrogenase family)
MTLDNKVVLITGASSGIGQAAAVALAQAGARLVLADIDGDGGARTIHKVEEIGGQATYITCDVTQPREVEAAVQRALSAYGALHHAVNSAGISGGGMQKPLLEWDEDEFDRIMTVNVRGIWLCMKAQIPAILKSGGGSIVNLASVAGLIGAPGGAAYAASKHAVVGLTRTAALEYGRMGVRVNALCPSFINTPMVTAITSQSEKFAERARRASPLHRLGTAEEVASAIVYLCSEGASFVNGVAFAVDGGLTAM